MTITETGVIRDPMTPLSYIVIAVCLSVVAFVAAMMGIGGGILYTPIQVLFGVDVHEAATTSLTLIMILSVGATFIYRRASMVDFKIAFVFEVFSVMGGFLGGYLSSYVSGDAIIGILIGVLVVASAGMFLKGRGPLGCVAETLPWYVWKRATGSSEYRINMFIAIPLCLLAGTISGMIGVGGGFIKVPMMVLLFAIPADIAIATSGFMVGLTAIGGFAGHLAGGHWNPAMTLILAPGVLAGAMLGAKAMLKIEKEKLRRIFSVLMLLLAVWLAYRFFG